MTVDMDGLVSRSLGGSGGSTTVEVSIKPRGKTKPTERHVALLIDTSGSMSGQKIQNAKNGAKRALDCLDETDYVSIVGFDSDTNTVVSMTEWGTVSYSGTMDDIESMAAGGGTDIYKGLETVRDQLIEDAPSSASAVKRIILLSDGQDRFDADTYRDLAAEFDDDGISIIAAGIGSAYDESVMLALANASGGTPADISESDINEFLEDTVSDTDSVVAPNPILEIEPRHGFVIDDEPAYFNAPKVEERELNTADSPANITLPELQLGESYRLSFAMLGQPKSTGIEHDIADLRVVTSSGSELAETTVAVEYADTGGLERADIEKARSMASVTTDIQDPDTSDGEVRTAIDKIEERGWKKTAESLEGKLKTASEDGGLIKISKSDIDER